MQATEAEAQKTRIVVTAVLVVAVAVLCGLVEAQRDSTARAVPSQTEAAGTVEATPTESRVIGRPNATLPNPDNVGTVTIKGLLERRAVQPKEVKAHRPDVFKPGYFSAFDVLVWACRKAGIDIQFHYDQEMRTHVIDSINGETNWYYSAIYDGSFRPEEPVHRMDTFPYKDRMRLEVYQVSKERIDGIHGAFRAEAERLERNEGKVVVPEVTIMAQELRISFKDVKVKAHNLRSDMFQDGVLTAADVMLSLSDEGKLTCDVAWLDKIGSVLVQGFYFTRFGDKKASGMAGFTYELGEKVFSRRRSGRRGRFGDNNFHMTSDIRVIGSPEYMAWRWTDLSFFRRRGPAGGMGGLSSEQMLRRLDQDGDGKLSKAEMPQGMQERWQSMDINGDGFVDQEELSSRRR